MKVLASILFISLLGFAYSEDTVSENGDSTDAPKLWEKYKCDADEDCVEGLVCKFYLSGCEEEKVCMCGGEPMTQVYHPGEKKCHDLATEINGTCAVGRQCWKWGQRCPTGGGKCVCQNADDAIVDGFCVTTTNLQIGDPCTNAADCYYINEWDMKICSNQPQGFPLATCVAPAANPRCACPAGMKHQNSKCVLPVGPKKAGEDCEHLGAVKDSCEAGYYCKACHKESNDYKCRNGQGTPRVVLGLVLSMLFVASLQSL